MGEGLVRSETRLSQSGRYSLSAWAVCPPRQRLPECVQSGSALFKCCVCPAECRRRVILIWLDLSWAVIQVMVFGDSWGSAPTARAGLGFAC